MSPATEGVPGPALSPHLATPVSLGLSIKAKVGPSTGVTNWAPSWLLRLLSSFLKDSNQLPIFKIT